MPRLLLCLALALGAAGCVDTLQDLFVRRALDRAAFELRCPREKLELHGLNARLDDRMIQPETGTQVGVSGCGHRVVYVYAGDTGWVLNSDSRREGP